MGELLRNAVVSRGRRNTGLQSIRRSLKSQCFSWPAVVKIAVIDVQGAIAATAEGKQALAELQSRFAPQEMKLQEMQQQIDAVQKKLTNGINTLSPEEKTRLQSDGQLLSRHLQRATDDLNDDVQSAQEAIFDNIAPKIIALANGYAPKNGFAMVLDASAQDRVVVYIAPQSDITQAIVHLYDETYPVKAANAPGAITAPSAPNATSPTPANR